ncbi:MAG: glycerophosphodiester phosphodiesterase family protein [Pseudoruegeria sp.]
MNDWLNTDRPLSIAHRGASAYAPANSLQAFEFAAQLGADMWEVDLRLTADQVIIAYHDDRLKDGQKISELTHAEVNAALPRGDAPCFSEVIDLAQEHNAGLYADIKAFEAAEPVCDMLRDRGFEKAILGAFNATIVSELRRTGCPYLLAILVPVGVDPFEFSGDAEIIHLCWETLERPQDLLDKAFFDRCEEMGKKVVLWHEENPERMADLRNLPVLGICSDLPQMVNPFHPHDDWPVQIVCHRGANSISPENSLTGALACFAAGFSHVELDVHITSDEELVVFHDHTLNRTSNGTGAITSKQLRALRTLSIGAWFSDHYKQEPIPTLEEFLQLANAWGGHLYIELKTSPAALIWDKVTRYALQDHCFFWSFNHHLLRDMRAISPDANIMMRRQDFENLDAALASLDPSLIEFTPQEDLSEIKTLKEKGIPSMIAYNGQDPDVFRRIAAHKPELINLHHPFRFVQEIFQIEVHNG